MIRFCDLDIIFIEHHFVIYFELRDWVSNTIDVLRLFDLNSFQLASKILFERVKFFDKLVDFAHVALDCWNDLFRVKCEWFHVEFEKIFFDDYKRNNIDEVAFEIVDFELDDNKKVNLIVLIVINVRSKILLEYLVDVFDLIVNLEMKRDE